MSQSVLSHGSLTRLAPRIIEIALAGLILTATFVGLPAQTRAGNTYQQISASELKSLIDSSQEILVIDTQSPFHYRLGHIPGAVNFEMPMEEMVSWNPAKTGGKTQDDFIALLGPDQKKPLIFYCLGDPV
jgi:thiosulfate/3-mercaptopyruvate sulfurtransferase